MKILFVIFICLYSFGSGKNHAVFKVGENGVVSCSAERVVVMCLRNGKGCLCYVNPDELMRFTLARNRRTIDDNLVAFDQKMLEKVPVIINNMESTILGITQEVAAPYFLQFDTLKNSYVAHKIEEVEEKQKPKLTSSSHLQGPKKTKKSRH